ncbi:MAG: SDR family NAD(P)-dependent oxidoreductase [Acidobacteria bacterium]|nr:SDR family NAD(P)-dependent oxidoreductase [Acidobacteriota bacterium]
MELAGTSAVITGGGNGIGRAIALALAREGANVAVADVEQDAAESVAREVEALGAKALAARGKRISSAWPTTPGRRSGPSNCCSTTPASALAGRPPTGSAPTTCAGSSA